MSDVTLTDAQEAELRRLKQYFPYRIVFGAVNPSTGDFQAQARLTRHQMNRLAREGWVIFSFGSASTK